MANNLKFVLVGLPQSGKTTILSMLPYFNHGARAGGLCEQLGVRVTVRAANRSTIEYVAGNRSNLATHGVFPAATDAVRQLAFDVNLKWPDHSETVAIEVPDIPGELWQQRLAPDDPTTRNFADSLVDCDGIILLVDPAGIAPSTEGPGSSDPVAIFQENCEMLYVALKDRLRATRRAGGDDATLPIPVAMVLTKAERYWSDPTTCRVVRRLLLSRGRPVRHTRSEDCWEYSMEGEGNPIDVGEPGAIEHVICAQGIAAERLVQVMKFFFHEVSYFAVSAVGMMQRDSRWVPNLVTEVHGEGASSFTETRVADPAHLRPIGLVEPIVGLVLAARPPVARPVAIVAPHVVETPTLPSPSPAPVAPPPVPSAAPRATAAIARPPVTATPARSLNGNPSPQITAPTVRLPLQVASPAHLVGPQQALRAKTPPYGQPAIVMTAATRSSVDEDFFLDIPTDPSIALSPGWDDLTPLSAPEDAVIEIRRKVSLAAVFALSLCAMLFLVVLVRR